MSPIERSSGGGGSFTSPLTTKGDIYGHSTIDDRIPVGSDTQVLTADSTQALGVRWAAPSSGLVKLFSSTLGASASSIDTGANGIASGHAHLVVFAVLQTDEAVTRSVCTWTFNNDSGANYDRQFLSASSTAVAGGAQIAQTGMGVFAHGAAGTAQYPGLHQWFIPQYTGTSFFKLALMYAMVADATAAQNQAELDTFGYRSTSAISRMAVAAPAGKNLVAGSTVEIYGTE